MLLLTVCMVIALIPGLGGLLTYAVPDEPEVTSASVGADWDEVQRLVGQYYGQWGNADPIPANQRQTAFNRQTANSMPSTALLGNGDIGVSSGGSYAGGPDNEKIWRIGKSDFWTVSGTTGTNPVSIGTVSVVGTEPIPNLAFGRDVKADGWFQDSGSNTGQHRPGNLTDGVDSTKWCVTTTSTHWAVVDLGEAMDIGRYTLKNSGLVGEENHNTAAWKLEYLTSSDNAIWGAIDGVDGSETISGSNNATKNMDWTAFESTYGAWQVADTVTNNPGNSSGTTVNRTLSAPIKARYVRLWIDNPAASGNSAARIHELELYAALDPGRNFAGEFKSVFASNNHPDFPPVRAVNGTATAGSGNEGWVSRTHSEQNLGGIWYLGVEFAEARTIGRYAVMSDQWSRTSEGTGNTSRAFRLQISTDPADEGKAWNDPTRTWTDVPGSSVTGNTSNARYVDITPVETKWVRLMITQASSSTTPGNDTRARVASFQLFAETPVDPEESIVGSTAKIAGMTVYADSSYNSSLGPERAINTQRTSGEGWASAPQGWPGATPPSWAPPGGYPPIALKDDGTGKMVVDYEWYWVVNFGKNVNLGRYILYTDGFSRGQTVNNTRDFDFQIGDPLDDSKAWNDPTRNWITVSSVRGNEANVIDRDLANVVTARWARVRIITPVQDCNETNGEIVARIPRLDLFPAKKPIPVASEQFYEKQNILNARVETKQTVSGIPLQMETYTIADGGNYIISKITNTSNRSGTLRVQNQAHNANPGSYPITAVATGDTITVTRTTQNPSSNYNRDIAWRSRAVIATKIVGIGGKTINVDTTAFSAQGRAYIDFTIGANETVYMVTAIGGGGKNFVYDSAAGTYTRADYSFSGGVSPEQQAANMLAAVTSESDVDILLAKHAAWWKDYWMSSYVDLKPDSTTVGQQLDTVQKYYYGAQYLLGCAVRAGCQPPGLMAHWRTNDSPSWNGDYHLNYNFISTFYGSASSNRPDQLLSAIMALTDYIPSARLNAGVTASSSGGRGIRNIAPGNSQPSYTGTGQSSSTNYITYRVGNYPESAGYLRTGIHPVDGIQGGLLYPVGIGPWGSAPDASYHNEAVNGPFSTWPIVEYYNYTLDEEEVHESYDMLKGTAIFGMNWMEEYEEGKFRLLAGYNEGSWSLNPAVELAAYKMVLEYAAIIGEQIGEDPALVAEWRRVRNGMPDQPTVMSSGNLLTTPALCYSLAQEEYRSSRWQAMSSPLPGDGNIIPLESIIPSGQLGYYSPDAQTQIARNTIMRFGNSAWSTINNFPKGFPVAARVKYNPSLIVQNLANMINQQLQNANLWINDNNHGIEKTGAVEAVNSLLLQGHLGVVKVFPNWIANRSASFTSLRAPGGFLVAAAYDGAGQQVTNLKISSTTGAPLSLAGPWGSNRIIVTDSKGSQIMPDVGVVPNYDPANAATEEYTFTFDTEIGETYTITKGSPIDTAPYFAALQALIAQAEALDPDDYLDMSGVNGALVKAKAITAAAKLGDIIFAYDELAAALQALGLKPTDLKAELAKLVAQAKGLIETGYTPLSWEGIAGALPGAETALADPDATLDDIYAAYIALNGAIQALEPLYLRLGAGQPASVSVRRGSTTKIIIETNCIGVTFTSAVPIFATVGQDGTVAGVVAGISVIRITDPRSGITVNVAVNVIN